MKNYTDNIVNAYNKFAMDKETKPNMHLYVDHSGSVYEYEKKLKNCIQPFIKLAKESNVRLFIHTFSHYLSDELELSLDMPIKNVYEQFEAFEKTQGGTSFGLIWKFINEDKTRQSEFSVMITDFFWDASHHNIKHPDNLYYSDYDVKVSDVGKRSVYEFQYDMMYENGENAIDIRGKIIHPCFVKNEFNEYVLED